MNIPEGWQLAPVEPTDEMIDAGYKSYLDWNSGTHRERLSNVIVAALAAAPTPAQDEPNNKGKFLFDKYTVLPNEQHDELRRAAEELVRIYFNADPEREEGVSFAARMIELRAALEK